MKDTALSETAMLASLRDIRLPPETPGGLVAELAVASGLAGLAALLVVGLLRLLSNRRAVAQELGPTDPMAALADKPEAERRIALLHLLRARAPERYAAIRGDLYRREGGIEQKALEAEVARLV
ncbi:hypothetical protein Q5Y75_07515 [Ruegeria sp. 2205SS24-7]|uniref:hypothetical protein n=1 Tax=Ruegeria discodermiae TaxID=3064389 RepID=UPI002740DE53|nr:hypothetical protein [Ruegeria sp. 2205SS24-7]MDP5217060.1 hypothetical protein [Ruegeria sp. 2205SS24-7]